MKGEEKMPKKQFVVVCTEYRGVFAGYATNTDSDPIVLSDAQMCVYWSQDTRGVMGLAADGPTSSCKITKPVPKMKAYKVTAVLDTTDDAEKAWQKCPWG